MEKLVSTVDEAWPRRKEASWSQLDNFTNKHTTKTQNTESQLVTIELSYHAQFHAKACLLRILCPNMNVRLRHFMMTASSSYPHPSSFQSKGSLLQTLRHFVWYS